MQKSKIRKSERGTSYLSDGKFALGVTLGLIAAALIELALDHYRAGPAPDGQSDAGPTVLTLLVALGSLCVAALALREQKISREAATDPVLVAHLGQREDAREVITLLVTNIGAGAALNVKIEASALSDDAEYPKLIVDVFARHQPFSVILEGRSVEFSLGIGYDLLTTTPLPPFAVNLVYADFAGCMYSGRFEIDIQEIEKLGAHRSIGARLASALERIENKL